jgi:chorismate mutase/prephenate dehydratase
MSEEIAYLGPEGTYSHQVTEKRFGRKSNLVPMDSVMDVCKFVQGKGNRRGIIPIENSSGGAIYETVDILLLNRPRIYIQEELSLDVKLALIGHPGKKIKSLYSHFVPIEHCSPWIRKHLPGVQCHVVASTAVAGREAAKDIHSAALASRKLAPLCGLKVLEYPVEADIPNVTTFLSITAKSRPITGRNMKTTLAVKLPNIPGALWTLLDAFKQHGVNLSRILSRPIRGCPREYAFLVDVQGSTATERVREALALARKCSVSIRVCGSFPCKAAYKS